MFISRTLLTFTLVLIILCISSILVAMAFQSLVYQGEITFVSSYNTERDIYLMDIVHRISINLTRSESDEYAPTWSPDGKRLAYVGNLEGIYDIYVQEIPRGKPQRITKNALIEHNITWSPDGNYIAFTSDNVYQVDEFYATRTKLFMVDLKNDKRVQDYMGIATSQSSLSWSANKELAFLAILSGGRTMIVSIKLEDLINPDIDLASAIREISGGRSPSWSGDGLQMAIQSPSAGSWDIYSVRGDGQTLTQLTTHPSSDYMPSWSPHSEWVAFVTWRDKNEEIYIVNSLSKQERRLTYSKANDSDPVWRP